MLENCETWTHSPLEKVTKPSLESLLSCKFLHHCHCLCFQNGCCLCPQKGCHLCIQNPPCFSLCPPFPCSKLTTVISIHLTPPLAVQPTNQCKFPLQRNLPQVNITHWSRRLISQLVSHSASRVFVKVSSDWVLPAWTKQDNGVGQHIVIHSILFAGNDLCPCPLLIVQTPFLQWSFLKRFMKKHCFQTTLQALTEMQYTCYVFLHTSL